MQQTNRFYMKDSFSEFPSYVERSSPKPKLLLIFIIVLVLIIAALAGLYFLGASKNNHIIQSVPAAPTPTIAIQRPTPSPAPKVLNRSDLTVAIKNGSGTVGAAKGISSYLNGLGYTIGTIGNADKFTYTGITVHVKKNKSTYLGQLQSDILENDKNASISAGIDDTITTDAEVIVGK
jgi:hypothetical protein